MTSSKATSQPDPRPVDHTTSVPDTVASRSGDAINVLAGLMYGEGEK